jgi:hypothetical protein
MEGKIVKAFNYQQVLNQGAVTIPQLTRRISYDYIDL